MQVTGLPGIAALGVGNLVTIPPFRQVPKSSSLPTMIHRARVCGVLKRWPKGWRLLGELCGLHCLNAPHTGHEGVWDWNDARGGDLATLRKAILDAPFYDGRSQQSEARAGAQQQPNNGLQIINAHEVVQRPVSWLWPLRLARGKITLIGGDPGLGKSIITTDMVARI